LAAPMLGHGNESSRWRRFHTVRLSLGGAALGTAILGVIAGYGFGYQPPVAADVLAAVAGGAIAAILLYGFHDH
jgi:hypothetical protein